MPEKKEVEKSKTTPKKVREVVELPSGPIKVGSEEAVSVSGDAAEAKEVVKEMKKAAKKKIFPEPTENE